MYYEERIKRPYCHKHSAHGCQRCIDELVELGIQSDKDAIALLNAKLKIAEEQNEKLICLLRRAKRSLSNLPISYGHGGDLRRITDALDQIGT